MVFMMFLSVSIGVDSVIASDSPRAWAGSGNLRPREGRVQGVVFTLNRGYSLVCFASIASCI
jgi:hypothetical protein